MERNEMNVQMNEQLQGAVEQTTPVAETNEVTAVNEPLVICYNGMEVPFGEEGVEYTDEQIKAALVNLFGPSLSASTLVRQGNKVIVYVQAGEKGSDEESTPVEETAEVAAEPLVICYNGMEVPFGEEGVEYTDEQIKAALVNLFGPSLSASTLVRQGNKVIVYVQAGEKGSDEEPTPVEETAEGTAEPLVICYNGMEVPFGEEGVEYTDEQIKAALVNLFGPSLSASTLVRQGNKVIVYVQAGEKGSDEEPTPVDETAEVAAEPLVICYNGMEVPFGEEGVEYTDEQIKAALVNLFGPSLSASTLVRQGNKVIVYVQAGEKGIL